MGVRCVGIFLVLCESVSDLEQFGLPPGGFNDGMLYNTMLLLFT